MHLFLLFGFLSLLNHLNAQIAYEKGRVIDSIIVSNTDNETFSLYFPESFTEDKPHGVVFVYDPMGRGRIGVQTFIPVSEKYSLILVCSNNSRNAPYPQNFDISNNLFNHIFSSFNIKADKMFASGFSGGSRLASAIASLTDKFAGVVGCGAGFSGLQKHTPSTQKYAYVGLCGNRDMNYNEMLENRDYLNLIQYNNTLITYDGEHRWPPAEQIVRAFDWLYLQRAKSKKSDQKNEVSAFYQADYGRLQHFLDNEQLLFADEQYARMIKDYAAVLSIDSVETAYRSFRKSKAYRKQAASLQRALKVEKALFTKFRSKFSDEFDGSNDPNFEWWKKEIAKLVTLKDKGDIETQKMVGRVKFGLFAMAFERKMVLPKETHEKQISALENLIQLVYPQ